MGTVKNKFVSEIYYMDGGGDDINTDNKFNNNKKNLFLFLYFLFSFKPVKKITR